MIPLLQCLCILMVCLPPASGHCADIFGPADRTDRASTPTLFGPTGLWELPTARILPDWQARFGYAYAPPYRVFSAGLGLFDRAEVTAVLTEVETVQGFPGEGFGNYRDRAAGAKLVLLPESRTLPQVALGVHDPFGTGLFPARYLVAGKKIGKADVSLGLAQGVLAGEKAENVDNILFASPLRRTRPYLSLSYPLTGRISVFGEYSPVRPSRLFGQSERTGRNCWFGADGLPFNAGLIYRPLAPLSLYAVASHGRDAAVGANLHLPLQAEGLFAWVREPHPEPMEKERWIAAKATNDKLALLLAHKIAADGFHGVRCQAGDTSVWIEADNDRSLSTPRSLARLGRLAHVLCPPRISVFYLNLKTDNGATVSLRTGRAHLRAFLESRLDKDEFLAFASMHEGADEHRNEFLQAARNEQAGRPQARFAHPGPSGPGHMAEVPDSPWFLELDPKVRTFLGNRSGYLHSKFLLRTSAGLDLGQGGLLLGEVETTLYTNYENMRFPALEDNPTRTDLIRYEQTSGSRLSMLALDQIFPLPWRMRGRLSAGYFESAYAGLGAELFRFVADGRAGLGLESQFVRKRDPDNQFALYDDTDHTTLFGNAYVQLWPRMGLDAGIKLGRFLGGDWGARFELRRTYNHVTVGCWWTVTDTSVFSAQKNRGYNDKGIFVRIPFSLFTDHDAPGHFSYAMSGFLRDQGQTVRQPRSLFPLDSEDTPARVRHSVEEMRQ